MSAAEPIESPKGLGRGASFARVGVAYVVALAAAVGTAILMDEGAHLHAQGFMRSYSILAGADLVATLAIFGFSLAFRNSSVYDPYWTAAPPIFCVGYWALGAEVDLRSVIYTLLVSAWAARLTFNWIRGWGGLDHEDFRYRDLQKKFGTGALYWLVSLAGLHLFPTAVVLLGLLPSVAIFGGTDDLGVLDLCGAAIMLAGIVIQAVADEQLKRFSETRLSRDQICEAGLWAYSRHPNYFGELCVWVGPVLMAYGSGSAAWWAPLGALTVLGLFLFASIPMMEQRQGRKPAYADYQRRVSMLLPLPPKR
jgi:steroid 5-alpha reductase family enzyme